MKRLLITLLLLASFGNAANAQVSVPNTFVTGTRILASEVNANFDALESGALNRAGGTITGNIVVDSGITIDTIDISAVLGGTGTPTFATITVTGAGSIGTSLTVGTTLGVTGATTAAAITASGTVTTNGTLDVNSTFTVGSGNVQPFASNGKIQAISSTYFDSLDGTNLTGLAKLAGTNTFTGQNDFLDYTESYDSPTISGGTLALNLNNGSHFLVALNANVTNMTVSNVTASKAVAFTIRFTADGTPRTVSWPTGTVWPSGVAPTMTSTNNKRDLFTLITYDGGTTWFGFVGGQNF
jgi:hypothetical protein